MSDIVVTEKDLKKFKDERHSEAMKKILEDPILNRAFNKHDERQKLLGTIKDVARGRRITSSVMKEVGGEMLRAAQRGEGGLINKQEALAWGRKYGIRYGKEINGEKNNSNMPKDVGHPINSNNVSSARPASSPMKLVA
jgi:hypothetical protein